MRARDTASRIEAYWVGPFEDSLIEIGERATHWEIEENDGAGSLLDGFLGVDDGWPTLREGSEYVYIDEMASCECCRGTGLRPGGRLRVRR